MKTRVEPGEGRAKCGVRAPKSPLARRLGVLDGVLGLANYTLTNSKDTVEQEEALELKKLLERRRKQVAENSTN